LKSDQLISLHKLFTQKHLLSTRRRERERESWL